MFDIAAESWNYSICLSGQKFSATIFIMKTNQILSPFSTATKSTIF